MVPECLCCRGRGADTPPTIKALASPVLVGARNVSQVATVWSAPYVARAVRVALI